MDDIERKMNDYSYLESHVRHSTWRDEEEQERYNTLRKEIFSSLKLQELLKEELKKCDENWNRYEYPCGEGIVSITGSVENVLQSLLDKSQNTNKELGEVEDKEWNGVCICVRHRKHKHCHNDCECNTKEDGGKP